HHCFCFLRYHGEEVLLICVNFGDHDVATTLAIPDLAFDMASIREGILTTTDLLNDSSVALHLSRTQPMHLRIGRRNAVVIPLSGPGVALRPLSEALPVVIPGHHPEAEASGAADPATTA
ncbi:MAG: hypothetical protein K2L35_00250, partial [Muribaculaceae bacterium]|nr:hypothetical protein [Muribaculaceae bacterium]